MTEEIKAIITIAVAKNLRISFCCIPGHVDNVGNEKADSATEEAAVSENSKALPHKDMIRQIREATRRGWQNE